MLATFFERRRFLTVPISLTGWLLALVAIGLCIYDFIDIDSRSHSVSDTLMNFVLNAAIVLAAYLILGRIFSRDNPMRRASRSEED